MLVLARKQGQSIVIGGNVVVKVIRLDGFQVRLGIDAPKEVPVHREEIQADIDRGKMMPPAGPDAL